MAGTLVTDVCVLAFGDLGQTAERTSIAAPDRFVSISSDAARPAAALVAPLREQHTPHLLLAHPGTLPAEAVERARRTKGVAAVEVVDAASAQVAGRRVGLLGVDPSTFRAFAPQASAVSDPLWQSVASGDLVVSFGLGQSGRLALGGTVTAGSSAAPGQVRVGAYATMGIADVDAVVSRTRARELGLPSGNALIVSARKTSPEKLGRTLRKILPRGTKVAVLAPSRQRAPVRQAPRVTGRPDGLRGSSTPITGNRMTPRMRAVVLELNNRFGPFPTIGCYRTGADAQDHGYGRACDFMESVGGRTPSASAFRHGDQVAAYATGNAARLGIHYVIWKQHIWNIRGGGWRRMADRGSITQNHYDHVHISVR
ncbi:hypothetical protein SAMN04489712_12319 [Thermomonospora echinospora]|uniref:ARB-07466-like C-terminal domain-containing protein n=1 Tax=Thermomonospora echinospora TaxID=1992 RepID=A0A1H6DV37_9ACTN|nr:hypothetical protein [Thermomonospora echinospora]SEG89089.1 hypothetical protein SAMN04489712_12319 [Thermomonospora echinospora]